ncbi:metal chelate transport ATP-binding protein [Brucella melitensis bv. 1 str. 16M]|nr:metal chelate transport ATP-binding protein [Brucella melitensis bv. 1 str. 16M]
MCRGVNGGCRLHRFRGACGAAPPASAGWCAPLAPARRERPWRGRPAACSGYSGACRHAGARTETWRSDSHYRRAILPLAGVQISEAARMTLLSVKNLDVILGGKRALADASFETKGGEFIGLVGPNGAGKTTLLRAIAGLVASSGQVSLAGRDLRHMGAAEKARSLAYLPQERDVAWPVSVHMLVSLGRSALKPVFAGLDRQDEAIIEAVMDRMDVSRFGERSVMELSGGERARVLIARVLAQDTPVILADEPVAGLDPAHQLTLMETFAELAREGRTVIASLHELSLAAQHCSRLILLDHGCMAADGTPAEVFTPQRLRDVYGIRARIMMVDGEFIVHPTALQPR